MKRVKLSADAGVSAGVLIRLLVPVLCLWLAMACALPSASEVPPLEPEAIPTAAEVPAEPEEPAAEEPEALLTRVTAAAATVREGPGTVHDPAFWVDGDTELTVVGRNPDGAWLHVGHEDRAGWIHVGLTDLAADVRAGLPVVDVPVAVEPEPELEPAPAPVVDPPAPQVVPDPQPEPAPAEPQPAADAPAPTLTVTGAVVNLRGGPSTDHPVLGQVRAGDALTAVGRNADGSWLQIVNPHAPDGSHAWIYGPLTDMDAGAARVGLDPVEVQAASTATQPAASTAPTSQPDPVSAPTKPAPGSVPACEQCPALPDFPEHGTPDAPMGPSVQPYAPPVWHAPDTYGRDLPGLDYDFKLVFSDASAMWDWSVRDFQGCYDAVRVHMGVIPKDVGLQRLEVRLADPLFQWGHYDRWDYATEYIAPWVNPAALPGGWPHWNPAELPHPDLAVVVSGMPARFRRTHGLRNRARVGQLPQRPPERGGRPRARQHGRRPVRRCPGLPPQPPEQPRARAQCVPVSPVRCPTR